MQRKSRPQRLLRAKSRIRSVSYLTWSYSSFTTMDEVIWSGLVFYSRSLFYKLGYVRSKDGLKQSPIPGLK